MVRVANARLIAMKIYCSIENAPSLDTPFEQRWEGPDEGLITAWASGLAMINTHPKVATAALRGELPVLAFKGGLEKSIEAKAKLGALHYLAMWQGLRNEPLDIDTDASNQRVCTKTNVLVEFTMDTRRLLATEADRQT